MLSNESIFYKQFNRIPALCWSFGGILWLVSTHNPLSLLTTCAWQILASPELRSKPSCSRHFLPKPKDNSVTMHIVLLTIRLQKWVILQPYKAYLLHYKRLQFGLSSITQCQSEWQGGAFTPTFFVLFCFVLFLDFPDGPNHSYFLTTLSR